MVCAVGGVTGNGAAAHGTYHDKRVIGLTAQPVSSAISPPYRKYRRPQDGYTAYYYPIRGAYRIVDRQSLFGDGSLPCPCPLGRRDTCTRRHGLSGGGRSPSRYRIRRAEPERVSDMHDTVNKQARPTAGKEEFDCQ